MYFDLTDDQKAIAATVETLLSDFVPEDKAVALFDAGKLDRALWDQLCQMGVGGIMVPDTHDGLGMDLLTLAAIQEKLGWAAAPAPAAENALAAWLVATFGTDAQRGRWLDALTTGEAIAAFALDEEHVVAPQDWSLAGPVLNGSKPFVSWGSEADLLVVGTAGGELVLVEATAPGVRREEVSATDRTRPLAHITFEGAAGDSLSTDGGAATMLVDALCVLTAADACGAGQRALALAVGYAKTRKQFDRLIGSFQGLKHQLANLAAEMEPTRYLVWYAAHAWDAIPDKRSYAASLAKAHVSEVAVRTARGAVEAHGGIGYTWEYPLHIYLKRAMHDRAVFGLPTMHRARSATLAGW